LIINEPEAGDGAAGARLDGDARHPERGTIIARRRLAGAEGDEFHGASAKLPGPDEAFEIVEVIFESW